MSNETEMNYLRGYNMYCTKCGFSNNDDAKFCAKCGNELHQPTENTNNDILSPNAKRLIWERIVIAILIILVVILMVILYKTIVSKNNSKYTDLLIQTSSDEANILPLSENIFEAPVYETADELEPEEYVVYPRSEYYDSFGITFYDRAIQIDDIVYALGKNITTTNDFFELLTKSEVDYTYNYNPDKLLAPHEYDFISIYRDDMEWIGITVINNSSNTISFSDAEVLEINYTENAMYFCRYFDGNISHADILNMSYRDAWEWICENFYGVSYNEYASLTVEEKKNFSDMHEHVIVKESFDTDADVVDAPIVIEVLWKDNHICSFIIDRNTSKVCDFSYNSFGKFGW